ncbi:MAG: hypothetical protein OCD01_19940 [Fibrobacterales bacterium]
MGIDYNGAKFLFHSKKLGVDFSQSAMIGRQALNLHPKDLSRLCTKFKIECNSNQIDTIFSSNEGFSESLFTLLGAQKIESFDNSSYENATHLHDMNSPITDDYLQRYSMVLDGGTLEHIFNFPTAISNCMKMLNMGGHFLSITNANNFMGHGFYQFSPELFYRIFSVENGFTIKDLIMFEDTISPRWYSVKDPDELRDRVTLINRVPTYILVIAQKVAEVDLFTHPPQQSDYAEQWESGREMSDYKKLKTKIRKNLSAFPITLLRRLQEILSPSFSSKFYKKL